MKRFAQVLMMAAGLAMMAPAFPSVAQAGQLDKVAEDDSEQTPPHVRRRKPVRRRRTPPPHVRRRPVRRQPTRVQHHHHVHTTSPTPRPRKGISEPRSFLYVGLGALGNVMVEDDDIHHLSQSLSNGGGMDFFLGLRFSNAVALELGGMFSIHDVEQGLTVDTAVLGAFTGDLKFFFVPSSRRVEPFLQVGAGVYSLEYNDFEGETLVGPGFQLGGGVDIRLSRMISLGTRILYRGYYMDNRDWAIYTDEYESTYMSNFTFGANLQFHF